MVLVAVIVAVASGAEAGQAERSRRLQEATSAPTMMDGVDMVTMSPTPSAATEAPTAAPTAADRGIDTGDEATDGAASLTSSSLFASAAVLVGSVAMAAAFA